MFLRLIHSDVTFRSSRATFPKQEWFLLLTGHFNCAKLSDVGTLGSEVMQNGEHEFSEIYQLISFMNMKT